MYKIAIIGLGYIGLPLAIEFSKKYKVVAFDINIKRIKELQNNYDITNEISKEILKKSQNIIFDYKQTLLSDCNIYIIAVPTPVDKKNNPDLSFIKHSTKIIGKFLKKNDLVIYESTVYPGFTEEICIPILEKTSKLSHNKDFFSGYSPERINPGDKKKNLSNITKITSGSNEATADFVDRLYKKIIKAGTHKVSSIKVAESAKIIENMQRDVNIAFMNQLSFFFDKLGINTYEVLKAASTKWNFVNFTPGLVGGHCVSVDPYYFIYKSKEILVDPSLFSIARKINNSVPYNIVKKITHKMKKNSISIKNSNILILGVSFKENCNDLRNSLVFKIADILIKKKINVDMYDPIVFQRKLILEKKYHLIKKPNSNFYDVIFLAVNHNYFHKLGYKKICKYGNQNHIFLDLYNSRLNKDIISLL